jgi:hypothetical protein
MTRKTASAHPIHGENGTFLEPDKAIETHPAEDAGYSR